MKQLYKIALMLVLAPAILFSNEFEGKHTKTKIINKEFKVHSNTKILLDNKYGSINIKTWDQNRVTIEVIISTNGNNESKVQNKLDQINIEFDSSNSFVSVKTIVRKNSRSNWNWFGNSNISMDIKYIVRMPISNSLNLDMDYGDTFIDKIEGQTNFNIDYGKLFAGELLNNNNNINLDYSRGSSIDILNGGTINIDYSTLDVGKSGKISLNSDYCHITFKDIEYLDFNSDYGSITVLNADKIIGNTDYVNLKFGNISHTLKIDADYGNLKIDKIGVNFEIVDIETRYVSVKIGVDRNSSFQLILDSSYGSIQVPNNFNFTQKIEKNSKKHYEGTYNGSKGKIIISTSYGSIKISER